jgi:predicted Zn finger-like uncharacterized protein
MNDQRPSAAPEYFTCPHCGTRYAVSITPIAAVEINSARCESCGEKMADWIAKEAKTFIASSY